MNDVTAWYLGSQEKQALLGGRLAGAAIKGVARLGSKVLGRAKPLLAKAGAPAAGAGALGTGQLATMAAASDHATAKGVRAASSGAKRGLRKRAGHWTQTPKYKDKLRKHVAAGSVPMASVTMRRQGSKWAPDMATSKKWSAKTAWYLGYREKQAAPNLASLARSPLKLTSVPGGTTMAGSAIHGVEDMNKPKRKRMDPRFGAAGGGADTLASMLPAQNRG